MQKNEIKPRENLNLNQMTRILGPNAQGKLNDAEISDIIARYAHINSI